MSLRQDLSQSTYPDIVRESFGHLGGILVANHGTFLEGEKKGGETIHGPLKC